MTETRDQGLSILSIILSIADEIIVSLLISAASESNRWNLCLDYLYLFLNSLESCQFSNPRLEFQALLSVPQVVPFHVTVSRTRRRKKDSRRATLTSTAGSTSLDIRSSAIARI